MASPVGGQFLFDRADKTTVSIGLVKQGQTTPIPSSGSTVAGAINIEIFAGLSTLPSKFDSNYNQGALVGDTVSGDSAPDIVNGLLTGRTLTLAGGDYRVTDEQNVSGANTVQGGPALIQAGSGNQTLVGAAGDTLVGGSGNQVLDGTKGNQRIQQGSALDSIFGGAGDTVVAAASSSSASGGQIDAKVGNMLINLNTLGTYTISLGAGDTVIGNGSAATATIAAAKGSLVNLTGDTGTTQVNSDTLTGGATIIGGDNSTLVFANTGDSVVGGQSGLTTVVDATKGGMSIVIGKGNVTVGGGGSTTGANDTITAQSNSSATVSITAGAKSSINLAGSNVTGGITGATGDTITAGGGNVSINGSSGGILVNLGSAKADVTGTTVAGSGDTIVGNSGSTTASLNYNVGASGATASGGDVINLNGFAGSATINAFSAGGTQFGSVGDTIIAGNGSDSVWGGAGDRIGVGSGPTVAGTHTFDHSTTVAGASVLFGTNDAVSSTTYDTVAGTAARGTVAGTSAATVRVDFFNSATDGIFYQNETTATTSAIIATAKTITVEGKASTQITLPDGTVMTLFNYTGGLTSGMFKA